MLLLASASQRRQDLLKKIGVSFSVLPPVDDGEVVVGSPRDVVVGYARQKAFEVSQKKPNNWVLAADTLVFIKSTPLGKPRNKSELFDMLERLQDSYEHSVWTGACIVNPFGEFFFDAEEARVAFDRIPLAELERYALTDEWIDKAAGYAIQGWAGRYAKIVQGKIGTVIGLSEESVARLFRESGYTK